MTNEIATAGPDWVCATTPVTTKTPATMITPTTKTVRSKPERLFLSRCSGSSVSRIDSSTDFTPRVPAVTEILLAGALGERCTGTGRAHAYASGARPGQSRGGGRVEQRHVVVGPAPTDGGHGGLVPRPASPPRGRRPSRSRPPGRAGPGGRLRGLRRRAAVRPHRP